MSLLRSTHLALLAVALGPACVSRERYAFAPADVRRAAAASPAERAALALPSERTYGRTTRAVWVRGDSLALVPVPDGDAPVLVDTAAPDRFTTTAVALTCGGPGISIIGSGFFAAGLPMRDEQERTTFLAGGVTALVAEGFMWTGTGMWIAGSKARPQEVRPGLPGVVYLDRAPSLPPPSPREPRPAAP